MTRSPSSSSSTGKAQFDAAEEVAVDPVGTGQIHGLLAAVAEIENARVSEKRAMMERTRMRSDRPGTPGRQRAHAADHQVDAHPGLRGGVERFDHRRLEQGIHFGDDARGLARLGEPGFVLDRGDHKAVKPTFKDATSKGFFGFRPYKQQLPN